MRHHENEYFLRKHPDLLSMMIFLKNHGCRSISVSKGNLKCTCPFHPDKTPSFSIKLYGYNMCYHCFGCGASGTIQDLIRRLEGENADVKAILRNIDPKYQDEWAYKIANEPYYQIRHVYEGTLETYQTPSSYLRDRGITDETMARFQVGCAALTPFIVAFPVRRVDTRTLIGMCFRECDTAPDYPQERRLRLNRGDLSKYHFEAGVQKDFSLFGVELIQDFDSVHLFEGPIDAMNFAQRHGTQVLACWGKSVSEPQLEYLRRFRQIHIVVDKDYNRAGLIGMSEAEKALRKSVRVDLWMIEGPWKDYTEALNLGLTYPLVGVFGTRSGGQERGSEASLQAVA
ncbi:MAG TPA: CHC2 zinc finger domain-containing protein [Coleofasciculaceae cyanobacterium]|jgi:DNA primase